MIEPTADGSTATTNSNGIFIRPDDAFLTPDTFTAGPTSPSLDQRVLAWVVTMRDGNQRFHPGDLMVKPDRDHLAFYVYVPAEQGTADTDGFTLPVAGYPFTALSHWERIYV